MLQACLCSPFEAEIIKQVHEIHESGDVDRGSGELCYHIVVYVVCVCMDAFFLGLVDFLFINKNTSLTILCDYFLNEAWLINQIALIHMQFCQ